jgi:16S rRNA C1402 (ribose-2'-O) methylase RsmI
VKSTREAVLDAELLRITSEYSVEQAQRVKTNFETVDPGEFILRLRNQLQTETNEENEHSGIVNIDWNTLGKRALKFLAIAPSTDFM